MNTPAEFNEIYNRDAWSTIRGFVYQVDYTLNRWIDLKENQALELERGEDIDIVNNDLQAYKQSRELEQIKFRESEVSLNRVETLEILKNFYCHKRNNPEINLLFRFITNTSYTVERPALFQKGVKGIDAWINLYKLDFINATDITLQTIKKHLLKKIAEQYTDDQKDLTETEKVAQQEWSDFGAYLEDDDQLIEFIQSFEWSFQGDDNVKLSEKVCNRLEIEYGDINIQVIYSRLFLYVFKLLSKKGVKSLSKEQFLEQCSLPTLSRADQKMLDLLNSLLLDINAKINQLDSVVSSQTIDIATLFGEMDLVRKDALFDFKLNHISIDPPELIKGGALRQKKIAEIKALFETYSWISFTGINGSGKSQLASLTCREFKSCYWLDMREFNQEFQKSTAILESFLFFISGQPILNHRKKWLNKVTRSLASDTLIILNDLPKLRTEEANFNHLIISLANACAENGIKLMSTCNFKIPLAVKHSVPNSLDYEDLRLSQEEIKEIMLNNGANEEAFTFVPLIAVKAYCNPRLVMAMIYHLISIDWGRKSNDILEVFFNNEFATDIINDAQRSISRFIPDRFTRELLYRLSLMNWTFGMDEVIAVSTVEQIIPNPNEHLQNLLHTWIQSEEKKSYQISPIIYNIGETNLSKGVVKNVNLVIAESILATKKLNQITASRVILAYLKGQDFHSACAVLLNIYRHAQTLEEVKTLNSWGFLNYWTTTDMPQEIPLSMQALLIIEQIRLFKILDRDTTPLFQKIKRLMDETILDFTTGIMIRLMAISQIHGIDLDTYSTYLDYIIENLEKLKEPAKSAFRPEMITSLLWLPIPEIKLSSEISGWLNRVELIEAKFGKYLFNDDVAQNAITLLCTKLVNFQPAVGPKETAEDKLQKLNILNDFFNKHDNDLLEAIVIKEIVNIMFAWQTNPNEALKMTQKSLADIRTPVGQYLLCENIGKLYFKGENEVEAQAWLSKALAYDCPEEINYTDTLVYAAAAISKTDKQKAIDYCLRAVIIANDREDFLEVDFCMMLGELAVAYWLNGDYQKMFDTFEDMISRLYGVKNDHFDDLWIKIFMITGHLTSYISGALLEKRIPKIDGEDFFEPYQGVYITYSLNLTSKYEDKNDPVIFGNMAAIAAVNGQLEKAYEQALKAFDLSRENKDLTMLVMISATCVQYALINFKPTEAFEAYLFNSAVSSHIAAGDYEERHSKLKDVDIDELLRIKPSPQWDIAEDTAVSFAVLPLFIMVLTAYLENNSLKDTYRDQYLFMLRDYLPDASNKLLFELLIELSYKILNKETNKNELINRGSVFGGQNKQHLQLVCYLGAIFLSNNNMERIRQLINIIPYPQKIHQHISSKVVEYILFPFVLSICIPILKEEFVGNKAELIQVEQEVINMNRTDPHAIQKVIRQVSDQMGDLKIEESRKAWLYELKEI